MKAGILIAAVVGMAAAPALAKQDTTVVIAPTTATGEQNDPATLINHAAKLVEDGKLYEAQMVYERLERMAVDYKLETSTGSWMYPAEVARRGLKEIAARNNSINLASAR